jgi:8-hydroxy-5-deazaflavin:NADPH oxidoreductase
VLVCGDDADAVATTVALVDRIPGLRGVAAGRLVHAATVEAMTALIIAVNKAHRVTAGVRITGL